MPIDDSQKNNIALFLCTTLALMIVFILMISRQLNVPNINQRNHSSLERRQRVTKEMIVVFSWTAISQLDNIVADQVMKQ